MFCVDAVVPVFTYYLQLAKQATEFNEYEHELAPNIERADWT